MDIHDLNLLESREAAIRRNGAVLAKYLFLLASIHCLRLVASLMTSGLVNPISMVRLDLGHVLLAVTDAVYLLCYLRLSEVSDRYGYVAWIVGGIAIVRWVPSLILGPERGYMTQYVMLFLTYGFRCLGIYLELQAHIDGLYRVDIVLSERWHGLSVWFVAVYGAEFICELPLPVLDLVSALVISVVPLVLMVLYVTQIVLLYQTAMLFHREFNLLNKDNTSKP